MGRHLAIRLLSIFAVLCLACTASANARARAHGLSVPQHVLTADFLGYHPTNHAWTDFAPNLTWAQTPQNIASAVAATGIKTILYTNPNRQAPHQPFYTSDETTFAHGCDNGRIWYTNDQNMDLMDPSSTNLWNLWLTFSKRVSAYAHYDAIFEDDADNVLQISQLPCNYDPQTWLNNSIAETGNMQQSGLNVIYNGLSFFGPGYTVSPSIALNSVTIGGMMEQCFVRPGTTNYQIAGALWQTIENTEIQMAQAGKLYFCYADAWDFPSSHALALRAYVYASFLLTYDPATSVLWETFPSDSGFHVNPEVQLVALNPVRTNISSISELHTQTQVFAREFLNCYVHGKPVGPCAAVVNPGVNAYAWPFQSGQYQHTMLIGGAGLLDRGWMKTSGPAPPATMAPLSGFIAFQ